MEKKTVRWGVLGCSGIGKSRTIPGLLACENAMRISHALANAAIFGTASVPGRMPRS